MNTNRKTYPLVEERVLTPVQHTGRKFWNRTRRAHDEIPRVSAHQVLVYRHGDQYITDHGVRGPQDDVVTGAASVTVVDCSVAVPVMAGTNVPSAETDGFTVQVAFHCTVTDPVAVVREGVTDVESRLVGYLRALPGLTDVTQEWPLDAGKEVTRLLTARLTAYLEMEPPRIAGMTVTDPYLEVLTPDEFAAQRRVADEERRAREQDRVKEEVARERARMEHLRKREQEQMDSEMRAMELRHAQDLEDLKRLYTYESSAEDQLHTHTRRQRDNEFHRIEALKDLAEFGTDAEKTDILALRNGEISYSDLAARQRDDARHRQEQQRQEEEHRREHAERLRRAEQDELRVRLERQDRRQEVGRQDRRAELAADREEKREKWRSEREEQQRQHAERREDELAARAERRHRADQRARMNQEFTIQAVNRGLLDNVPLDARALIERLGSDQGIEEQGLPIRELADSEVPQLEKGGDGTKSADASAEDAAAGPYRGEPYEQDGRRDGGYDTGHGEEQAYDPAEGPGRERHGSRTRRETDDAAPVDDGSGAVATPAAREAVSPERSGPVEDRAVYQGNDEPEPGPKYADGDLGEAGREERGR
ncbi:hypothetical protein ACFYY1_08880 [Streptomyces sp. NPDC001890]|uniref:hypothetical protein n=1 Tax=Streptomyces sp. NPDC001890 TaxID=3364620 RepID=UPI0036AD312B